MQVAAAGGAAPQFTLTTGRDRRRWHGEGGPGTLYIGAAAGDACAAAAEGDVLDLVPCYDLVRRAVRCVGIAPEAASGVPWSEQRMEEARRCVEIGTALHPCFLSVNGVTNQSRAGAAGEQQTSAAAVRLASGKPAQHWRSRRTDSISSSGQRLRVTYRCGGHRIACQTHGLSS